MAAPTKEDLEHALEAIRGEIESNVKPDCVNSSRPSWLSYPPTSWLLPTSVQRSKTRDDEISSLAPEPTCAAYLHARVHLRFEQLGRFFARVGEFVFATHALLALAVKHFLLH